MQQKKFLLIEFPIRIHETGPLIEYTILVTTYLCQTIEFWKYFFSEIYGGMVRLCIVKQNMLVLTDIEGKQLQWY